MADHAAQKDQKDYIDQEARRNDIKQKVIGRRRDRPNNQIICIGKLITIGDVQ